MQENNQRQVIIDQRALISNAEGKVLLTREHDLDWDLPGGVLVEGLTWRECLEELIAEKLDLQIMTRQPIYAADFQDPETGDYTYMVIIEAQSFSSDFDAAGYSEVKWFSEEELKELTFAVYEIKEGVTGFLQSKSDRK